MFEWIVKKVIVGKVNGLLKAYEKDVGKARETLKTWTGRIKKVLACLEGALARLDDNQLTAEELRETGDDLAKVVKEW